MSRPEVFHLVREEYEKLGPVQPGVSICALVEQPCIQRLERIEPARVA